MNLMHNISQKTSVWYPATYITLTNWYTLKTFILVINLKVEREKYIHMYVTDIYMA